MKQRVAVFLFRRDLRLQDNLALAKLVVDSQLPILPIFIFNSHQVHPTKNPYYSKNAVEFMIECLQDLNSHLSGKLQFFEGKDTTVLQSILAQGMIIDTLAFNADYTPYARHRDQELRDWCTKKGIAVLTAEDYTLFPLSTVQSGSGKHYEVFTPFYRKCLHQATSIAKPITAPASLKPSAALFTKALKGALHAASITKYHAQTINPQRTIKGGRPAAEAILARIRAKEFQHYDKERDFPAKAKTTKLSAYLKFGCISVREAFHAVREAHSAQHGLARELLWREFYAHVTAAIPRVLQGQVPATASNLPLRTKYDHLKWHINDTWFKHWCAGTTGFPLVDAAMRCLNATGFLHNRLRMVVAMFLTKDMRLDWRLGERYFATRLVDYDPASNSGGWQWSASVGADAQPYFRIFNPWSQSKRFDPDAAFIKAWVPDLSTVPAEDIHQWDKKYHKHVPSKTHYPIPILDHAKETKLVKDMFMGV